MDIGIKKIKTLFDAVFQADFKYVILILYKYKLVKLQKKNSFLSKRPNSDHVQKDA